MKNPFEEEKNKAEEEFEKLYGFLGEDFEKVKGILSQKKILWTEYILFLMILTIQNGRNLMLNTDITKQLKMHIGIGVVKNSLICSQHGFGICGFENTFVNYFTS